jgi:hypothetical protein
MAHLTDSGLVSKNSKGDLVLTPYSKATISLIPSYNFLFNNNDYFLDHNLGPCRYNLYRGSAIFRIVKLCMESGDSAAMEDALLTSTEYIKEIMTQVPLDLIETLSLKIPSGVDSHIYSLVM